MFADTALHAPDELLSIGNVRHVRQAYAASLYPLLENLESLEKALKLLLKTTTDGTCGNAPWLALYHGDSRHLLIFDRLQNRIPPGSCKPSSCPR